VGATAAVEFLTVLIPGFNPRPPRKVGATPNAIIPVDIIFVSILAHLERWALPQTSCNTAEGPKFQSSPTSKGGRYNQDKDIEAFRQMFQSSPTSKGGRYTVRSSVPSRLDVFQSSPTSKGGRYRMVVWCN